jgi:hypothetical protein
MVLTSPTSFVSRAASILLIAGLERIADKSQHCRLAARPRGKNNSPAQNAAVVVCLIFGAARPDDSL